MYKPLFKWLLGLLFICFGCLVSLCGFLDKFMIENGILMSNMRRMGLSRRHSGMPSEVSKNQEIRNKKVFPKSTQMG